MDIGKNLLKQLLIQVMFFSFWTFVCIPSVDAAPGDITTVAGGGVGDGGAAISARLTTLLGIFVDGSGNVYIADRDENRIRKVDPSGTISTVAGNGAWGFSGDGGSATDASLFFPTGVFVDGSGVLYIADQANHRVRKVDASGTISTIAGDGFRGDRNVGRFAGDGGPATEASLYLPTGVFVDESGTLYIADGGNHRVRKVDSSGQITTVTGNGLVFAVHSPGDVFSNILRWALGRFSGDGGSATDASLNFPTSLSVDGSGNLLIADSGNARIRKVDGSGTITTVVGSGTADFSGDGGPATDAGLSRSEDIFLDGSGNLYFTDADHHRIRKVDGSGTITTVVGSGFIGFSGDGNLATNTGLNDPNGVFVDTSGNIYIADTGNHRIRKVDTSGRVTTLAGGLTSFLGDGESATDAALDQPNGLCVDRSGHIYISDAQHHRVRRVDAATGIITTLAGTGTSGFSGDGSLANQAQINVPFDVCVDGAGNLYIADAGNGRIRKVDTRGIITTVAGGGSGGDGGPATQASLNGPTAISIDDSGNLYIADTNNHRVRKVNSLGIITTVAGNGVAGFSGDGGPATRANLDGPLRLFVDGSGALYISDGNNERIRKVDTSGIITTVAGNGFAAFTSDGGPATEASISVIGISGDDAGNLYIADFNNHRIRKVDPSGIITTVAGDGNPVFFGDGGPATQASLRHPHDIFSDGAGNLYIALLGSNRIRRVAAGTAQVINASASDFDGNGTVDFVDFIDFVTHFGKE